MKIRFTIPGNQENPDGNPIPKAKLTKGQQWGEKAQRYAAWKQYVQGIAQPYIIAAAIDMPAVKWDGKKYRNAGRYTKPITLKDNLRMDLMIYFADEHHADPESIFGSIADALFLDDKHLAGSIEFTHAPDKKGKTEVTLTL